jgi:tetratricopeptide (TPR) repeat protein
VGVLIYERRKTMKNATCFLASVSLLGASTVDAQVPFVNRPQSAQGMNVRKLTPAEEKVWLEYTNLVFLGKEAFRQGDYVKAEPLFRQASESKVLIMDIEGRYGLARTLFQLGNHTEALEVFKKLLTEPITGINSLRQQSLPWMECALVYSEIGKKEEAINAYKQGYAFLMEEMKGHFGKKFIPIEEFKNYFAFSMRDLIANIHLAIGLNNFMDVDLREDMKDVEEFEKAVRINPKSTVSQFYQGYALERRGKPKEAKIIFEGLAKQGEGLTKSLAQQAASRLK